MFQFLQQTIRQTPTEISTFSAIFMLLDYLSKQPSALIPHFPHSMIQYQIQRCGVTKVPETQVLLASIIQISAVVCF
jgi:hypothetical protein